MKIGKHIEMFTPLVFGIAAFLVLLTTVPSLPPYETIQSTLEACMTAASILIGFICGLLPVILSKSETSKKLRLLFRNTSIRNRFKLFLHEFIMSSVFFLILSVILSLVIIPSIYEAPAVSRVYIILFSLWCSVGVLFIASFTRIVLVMIETIFIKPEDDL